MILPKKIESGVTFEGTNGTRNIFYKKNRSSASFLFFSERRPSINLFTRIIRAFGAVKSRENIECIMQGPYFVRKLFNDSDDFVKEIDKTEMRIVKKLFVNGIVEAMCYCSSGSDG